MLNYRILSLGLPFRCVFLYLRLRHRSRLGAYFRARSSTWSYERVRHGFRFRVNNSNTQLPTIWLSVYAFIRATTAETLLDDSPRLTPKTTPSQEKEDNIDIDTLLFEADDLFDQCKYSEVVELLQNLKDCDNGDVLWRLCKALYFLSKEKTGGKVNELITEAYNVAKRGLEVDDNNYAIHKWYSVLLDAHAQTQGFRARLNEIMNVKYHMMRAIELNPTDATTLYMLGSWCFGVSDLPWYQRKAVIALFGSFPTSSFDEALYYFKKAEETKPNFYSLNLLMLGKTYMKLQDFEEARRYLTMASTYPVRSDEDQQASKEATDLLKQLTS